MPKELNPPPIDPAGSPHMPLQPPLQLSATKQQIAARILNEMASSELEVFGKEYGFDIRHALAKTKQFSKMTPVEKEAFAQYHGIKPA